MANYDKSPLRDVGNVKLFNHIRYDQSISNGFRDRIPAATRANMRDNMERLLSWRPGWNEFCDALVNRVAIQVVSNNQVWYNPLAEFKRPSIEYGDTIEEYKVGLVNSYTYDHNRESTEKDLFGTNTPDVKSVFHTVDREEYYPFTIREDVLKRAFLADGGLSNFVTELMNAPITSSNNDEFRLTCNLFAQYEAMGGFYHMRIPSVSELSSDGSDARLALRRIKALANTLPFLSTKYNAAHMPVFCSPEDLVIFCTPEFRAALDVEALASAFHQGNLDIPGRVITIPKEYFGIDHCEAIITTKDFFVIADTLRQNTSQYNAHKMQSNYFHHVWQIISASLFVPAVMLSTQLDDEVITVTAPITGISDITIEPKDGNAITKVERGDLVQMLATPIPATDSVGVQWSVSGVTDRTDISPTGVLRVYSGEPASSVKVTATAKWVHPDTSATTVYSKDLTVPIVGTSGPEWPIDHSVIHAANPAASPGRFAGRGQMRDTDSGGELLDGVVPDDVDPEGIADPE